MCNPDSYRILYRKWNMGYLRMRNMKQNKRFAYTMYILYYVDIKWFNNYYIVQFGIHVICNTKLIPISFWDTTQVLILVEDPWIDKFCTDLKLVLMDPLRSKSRAYGKSVGKFEAIVGQRIWPKDQVRTIDTYTSFK